MSGTLKVYMDPDGKVGSTGTIVDPAKSLKGLSLPPEKVRIEAMLRVGKDFKAEEIVLSKVPYAVHIKAYGNGKNPPKLQAVKLDGLPWLMVQDVEAPVTIGPSTKASITVHHTKGSVVVRGLAQCACSIEDVDGDVDIDECTDSAITVLLATGKVTVGEKMKDCSVNTGEA